MADELSEEKRIELWKAFHDTNLLGVPYNDYTKKQAKLTSLQNYYTSDDIFRREIDGLRQQMKKKKISLKAVDKKTDEFLKEAEYRRYIATFEHMQKNYNARKNQMAKIQDALKQ